MINAATATVTGISSVKHNFEIIFKMVDRESGVAMFFKNSFRQGYFHSTMLAFGQQPIHQTA